MGGAAREWSTELDGNITPGSTLNMRLVMTKFNNPAVRIGYEIRLD